MIYTIEKANLIEEQLKKFTSGYTYHVAGHFSNIDFWINEVKEALHVIDNHKKRFDNMYHAQDKWVKEHNSTVYSYCIICGGECELSDDETLPSLPTFKHKVELKEARRNLVDACYFFLVRCYNIGLLTLEELKTTCDSIETSIDPSDLKKLN